MRNILLLLIFIFSGCSALKEKTGEYVTEAVVEKITADIDKLLEKRGLSVKEIKNVVDLNSDRAVSKEEVFATVKELARDYAIIEAKNVIDEKIAENNKNFTSQGELKSKLSEFWNWILGLLSAYLGKQILSAKNDGKRDQRLALLEKTFNRDFDGDGSIGSVITNKNNITNSDRNESV